MKLKLQVPDACSGINLINGQTLSAKRAEAGVSVTEDRKSRDEPSDGGPTNHLFRLAKRLGKTLSFLPNTSLQLTTLQAFKVVSTQSLRWSQQGCFR